METGSARLSMLALDAALDCVISIDDNGRVGLTPLTLGLSRRGTLQSAAWCKRPDVCTIVAMFVGTPNSVEGQGSRSMSSLRATPGQRPHLHAAISTDHLEKEAHHVCHH